MTPPDEELVVRFGALEVGRLRPGADGRMSFRYAPAWLTDDARFPVSVSLALREEPYSGGAGHAFFANLLPEGAARQAVCARLGISPDNDVALLRAIGGECAGALSIVAPDAPPTDDEHYRYESISDHRLQQLVASGDAVPLLLGGRRTRLSLAGAQDKLPVAVFDGRVQLPLEGAPSTHILKLPNRTYKHLPVNEAFVIGLARSIELDVVDAALATQTKPPCLLVERYDRLVPPGGRPVLRLHQEDLCQALGLPPTRKYELEGGPSLATAIRLVRDHVNQPTIEVPRILAWQAFNVIVGNSAGHGKNLAILYEAGAVELAPFYDLVSTREYDSLDRSLAMAVGGRRNPDQATRAQWEHLADELEIGRRYVVDLVRGVAERCADALTAWKREFRERHGEQSVLQTLPDRIRRRGQRFLRNLG